MVKRFIITYIYITSDETITEDDIRKNITPKINVFDNIKYVTINEI